MFCIREGSLYYMLITECSICMLRALVREPHCRPQTIAAYPSRHTISGEHHPDFLNSSTLARSIGCSSWCSIWAGGAIFRLLREWRRPSPQLIKMGRGGLDIVRTSLGGEST
jgi:hypothetical protein